MVLCTIYFMAAPSLCLEFDAHFFYVINPGCFVICCSGSLLVSDPTIILFMRSSSRAMVKAIVTNLAGCLGRLILICVPRLSLNEQGLEAPPNIAVVSEFVPRIREAVVPGTNV